MKPIITLYGQNVVSFNVKSVRYTKLALTYKTLSACGHIALLDMQTWKDCNYKYLCSNTKF
jgi:hypothetical protein